VRCTVGGPATRGYGRRAVTTPGHKLRALLAAADGPILEPCVYNALTARVAAEAGFEVIGLSGYALSATLLGKPDVGLLTLTEVVTACRYVTEAVDIPVISDGEDGYGNAVNVMRTTHELIGAGAAAMHIEDQTYPKRSGQFSLKSVVSPEEAVGKVRAADRARREEDPGFMLVARTDARGVANGTLEEAIERCHRYIDAGADLVFPEGLLSDEEVEEFAAEFPGRFYYEHVELSSTLTFERLRELNVALVTNVDAALLPSLFGTYDYMVGFRDGTVEFQQRYLESSAKHPLADVHSFMGLEEMQELEALLVPAPELRNRYARNGMRRRGAHRVRPPR
jgi:2-methylisocitrate lyase-like PEP mutase family enzyme